MLQEAVRGRQLEKNHTQEALLSAQRVAQEQTRALAAKAATMEALQSELTTIRAAAELAKAELSSQEALHQAEAAQELRAALVEQVRAAVRPPCTVAWARQRGCGSRHAGR
jgi:hypothetical protein